jgi:hypothetical protein
MWILFISLTTCFGPSTGPSLGHKKCTFEEIIQCNHTKCYINPTSNEISKHVVSLINRIYIRKLCFDVHNRLPVCKYNITFFLFLLLYDVPTVKEFCVFPTELPTLGSRLALAINFDITESYEPFTVQLSTGTLRELTNVST